VAVLIQPRFSTRAARRNAALALLGSAWLVAACEGGDKKAATRAAPPPVVVESTSVADTLSTDTGADTAGQNATATVHLEDTARVRGAGIEHIGQLPPLADSIANQMTFFATFQTTFLAASRAKHLLLDIGRVDAKLKGKARLAAYHAAVQQLSPVKLGDRFVLHGPWGSSEATVTGFDQWHGRIVARLQVPPNVDSLAREKLTLVALAVRADSDSASAPTVDSCAHRGPVDSTMLARAAAVRIVARLQVPPNVDSLAREKLTLVALAVRADSDSASAPTVDSCAHRGPVDSTMLARAAAVRDSLMLILQADTAHMPPDVLKGRKLTSSQIYGCFGSAHVLLFANSAADVNRYTREFAVLIDTTGHVVPLRVADIRFKVHDAIRALDVDGDKVDDVSAIGRGELTGGTVILRLDVAKKRLTYVTSGFAWEDF